MGRRTFRSGGVALLLLGLVALLALNPLERLETNVTGLLPATEQDPAAQLVRALATGQESRTALLVIDSIGSAQKRDDIRREITQQLQASPLIAEARSLEQFTLSESHLENWYAHAIPWFWPQWWEEHDRSHDAAKLAQVAVESLEASLNQPESFAWEAALDRDPLLLVPFSLAHLRAVFPLANGNTASDASAHRLRWWLQLNGSPFESSTQKALESLLAELRSEVNRLAPEAELDATSVTQIAAASEAGIRAEVFRLNLCAGLSVVVICLLFLRRWQIVLPVGAILAAALIGSSLSVFSLFSSVHVLTLVLGSILLGVAIDYGLHVELHNTSQRHSVSRPLLIGGLSSIGGFAVLLTTSLPLLQQLGAFLCGGLLSALLAGLAIARWDPPRTVQAGETDPARRILWGKPLCGALVLLGVASAGGISQIRWADAIRELNYPLPELERHHAELQAQFQSDDGTGYRSLLTGPDWQSLHDASAAWAETPSIHSLATWATAPDSMRAAQEAARSMDFAPAFEEALEEAGFVPEAFAPFFEAWQQWIDGPLLASDAEAIAHAQLASLPGPARLLAGSAEGVHWWVINHPEELDPQSLEGKTTRLIPLEQLQSLDRAFGRYREKVLRAALYGLGALALGLCLGCGPRGGTGLLFLTFLPAAAVLGLHGWLGQTLNLFHLLGTFLAVCLTLDYLVFAQQARIAFHRLPRSISLSALTTGLSFGWLATSAIPAVADLGQTVAPIIALAWLAALLLTSSGKPSLNSDHRGH